MCITLDYEMMKMKIFHYRRHLLNKNEIRKFRRVAQTSFLAETTHKGIWQQKKVAQTSSEYFRHFHSPLPYTDFNILFGNEKYTASVTPLHSYFISMVDYITPLITLIMGVINDRTCLKMVLVDSTYTQTWT